MKFFAFVRDQFRSNVRGLVCGKLVKGEVVKKVAEASVLTGVATQFMRLVMIHAGCLSRSQAVTSA